MIVDFVLITGMSLLFILVVFILKSSLGLPKRLLSVFFINSFFILLYYYAYVHQSKLLGAIAIIFGNGSGFLLGPFLLFYIQSLFQSKEKIIRPLLFHLIVFFLFWLLVSLPAALSMAFGLFNEYHNTYVLYADYFNLLENIYFLIFIIVSFKQVQKIAKAHEDAYSFIDINILSWIKYLLNGLMCIILLDSIFSIYELNYPMIPWNIGTIIAFAYVVLICVLGYKGMFQAKILLPNFLFEENSSSVVSFDIVTQRPVKQLNSFSSEDIKKLKSELFELVLKEKIYLNEDLTLSDLAEKLNITDKKLSELLNEHLGTNFYNFINDYRIEEVKAKMGNEKYDKFTLLSIAFDSGFQSKTSFYRVFKKKTGVSPSKYKKQLVDSAMPPKYKNGE